MYQAGTQFPPHIPHVLKMRPEPEMIWIDAAGIVAAGAIVEDVQAIRDRSAMDQPRRLMGLDDLAILAARPDAAVVMAARLGKAGPEPTAIRLDDLRPESFGQRCASGTLSNGAAWPTTETTVADSRAVEAGRSDVERQGARLADAGHAARPHGTLRVHRDVPLSRNRGAGPGLLTQVRGFRVPRFYHLSLHSRREPLILASSPRVRVNGSRRGCQED